jgi:hypothetical protein
VGIVCLRNKITEFVFVLIVSETTNRVQSVSEIECCNSEVPHYAADSVFLLPHKVNTELMFTVSAFLLLTSNTVAIKIDL